jgi:hypothetical protein
MKNSRILLILTLVLLISLLFGCFSTTKEQPVGKHEIIRQAVLGTKWQMYQLRIDLDAGSEFDILLILADGDKVDGFFYPEKGSGVTFQIKTGSTIIYKLEPPGVATGGMASDRFSFTASQAQGASYILNLRNGSSDKRVTTFVEVIYPSTGSIYIPLEAK